MSLVVKFKESNSYVFNGSGFFRRAAIFPTCSIKSLKCEMVKPSSTDAFDLSVSGGAVVVDEDESSGGIAQRSDPVSMFRRSG